MVKLEFFYKIRNLIFLSQTLKKENFLSIGILMQKTSQL